MARLILVLVAIRPFVDPFYNVVLWKIGSYDVNPLSIWAVLVVLISIGYWLPRREDPVMYPGSIWLLLFVLSLLTGAILSVTSEAFFTVGTKLLPWLLFIPTSASIITALGKEKVMSIVFHFACIFTAFNMILLVTGSYESNFYRIGEFYGLYKGPHGFSFMHLQLLPFILYRIYVEPKDAFLPTVILILSIGFICLTFVRSGIVAMIIGLSVFYGFNRSRMVAVVLACLLVAGLAVFVFGDTLGQAFASRISDFSDAASGGNPESMGSGRWGLWKLSLLHWGSGSLVSILLGNGYGYLERYLGATMGNAIWAHNDYVDLLITNGLVTLILFVTLQYKFLRMSLRVRKKADHLIGSLGVTSLAIMVSIGLNNGVLYAQSNIFFACIMGLVISEMKLASEGSSE